MLANTPGAKRLGADGHCFAAALWAVRTFGGVIEHPETSHAWTWFGIQRPPRQGLWIPAEDSYGWTCCVEQGHYSHRARKATWLYVVGLRRLPSLIWGASDAGYRLDEGYHSAEERRKSQKLGTISRIPKKERARTPEPFRDLLLGIARECQQPTKDR